VAAFRYDVSPAIGAGHMARCLALGAALERHGYMSVHVVGHEGIGLLPAHLRADAIAIRPGEAGGEVLLRTLGRRADLCVVDHYGIDGKDESELARACHHLAVIDDLADRRHAADALIDSAPVQAPGRYATLIGPGTLELLGADYALLRADFIRQRFMPSGGATTRPSVLISMGGTDPVDATSMMLEEVMELGPDIGITIVLGRGAPHRDEVAARVAAFRGRADVLSAVEDMASLANRHTLAVGAPGVSALERACLGLAQVLVTTAANQATVAMGLDRAGAALCLGPVAELVPGAVRSAASDLLTNSSRREQMRHAARRLVDGRGAPRVAAHLVAPQRDRQGAALIGRRARFADGDELLRWQCHPETRRYARTQAAPTPSEHARFMQSRLDGSEVMEVITRAGRPIGVVRAEYRNGACEREVSITTAPEERGRGVGLAALKYLDALLPGEPLVAYVDPENKASLALFTAAGYLATGQRRLFVQTMQSSPTLQDRRFS